MHHYSCQAEDLEKYSAFVLAILKCELYVASRVSIVNKIP